MPDSNSRKRIIKLFDIESGQLAGQIEDPVIEGNMDWISKDFRLMAERSYYKPTQYDAIQDDRFLAVFNKERTRIITTKGLLHFSAEERSPDEVDRWVKSHIPLRLIDGCLRPATAEEMHVAELAYGKDRKGQAEPPN